MSVEYDNATMVGEEYRMAPEGIITDDNIDQLTEMALSQAEPEPEPIPTNKMEAPIKEKVNRKKQRSEKQKETFEKARQKRLENIARKKAEREAREKQVEADMDKVKQGSSVEIPQTTNPELPSMEEQVKQLEEIQNEVIKQEPILNKPKQKIREKKPKKVVYVEESSSEESSSEEEIVYVKRKPQRKPRRKVVYQDDYGEEAEFIQPPTGPYPRRNKPISFSDVFKYA